MLHSSLSLVLHFFSLTEAELQLLCILLLLLQYLLPHRLFMLQGLLMALQNLAQLTPSEQILCYKRWTLL